HDHLVPRPQVEQECCHFECRRTRMGQESPVAAGLFLEPAMAELGVVAVTGEVAALECVAQMAEDGFAEVRLVERNSVAHCGLQLSRSLAVRAPRTSWSAPPSIPTRKRTAKTHKARIPAADAETPACDRVKAKVASRNPSPAGEIGSAVAR